VVLRGGYGLYHFPLPARTFNGMRGNPPLQGSYSYNWNDSANAPDALPNYFLRHAPTVIAGVNSADLPELSCSQHIWLLTGQRRESLNSRLGDLQQRIKIISAWHPDSGGDVLLDLLGRGGTRDH